jgi:drug/metabolite transporter (DMT)-like permease
VATLHSARVSRPVSLRVHLALTTVAVLFSLNYVVSKVALGTFSALSFAYLRVLGSALILATTIRPGSRFEILNRQDRWRIVGYAVLGVVMNQGLFLAGLAFTTAHVAALLMTLIPMFTLGAAIVIKRERASLWKIGGIALAFSGAVLVVSREGLEGDTHAVVGVLLLIANALSYSMYLVLSRPHMARLQPQRVIARMFGIASILMIPLCGPSLIREKWSEIPVRSWLGLLFVIIGPTVGAYLLNAWALAHCESSLVAVYTYLQPFFTAILAAVFLHETIGPIVVVAAALIFAGVFLSGRPAPGTALPSAVPGSGD